MDILKTNRLKLVCLTYEDMCQSKENGNELAQDFVNAYDYHKALIQTGKFHEKDLLWFRLWDIVQITDSIPIGGICFKGPANDKGQVEIGYGISDEYQNKGYATEAIRTIIEWAKQQEGVSTVMAEIEKVNLPSQRVAAKCGMNVFDENEENLYWLV
ncbi:GNAT family N-acetyltransferase [Gorillibacterium massiliense]|uniref:GNAT family N-acetyltransferase n=1 Tax=Gorillibacterium massiliense TaxID=1280390 RepID=UPI0004B5E338|nr:GNAT family N-acetyltransferase [Gorillibacterium massiliense]